MADSRLVQKDGDQRDECAARNVRCNLRHSASQQIQQVNVQDKARQKRHHAVHHIASEQKAEAGASDTGRKDLMHFRFFRHPLDVEQPRFRLFRRVQSLLDLAGKLVDRRYFIEPRRRQRDVAHTGKFLFFSAFCCQENAAAQYKRIAGFDAVRPRNAVDCLLHTEDFRSARQQNIACQRCHIERFSR